MGVSCRPGTSHYRVRWTRVASSARSRFRRADAIRQRTRVKSQGGAAPYVPRALRSTAAEGQGLLRLVVPASLSGGRRRRPSTHHLSSGRAGWSAICFGGHRRRQTVAFAVSGGGTAPARVPGGDAFPASARALTLVAPAAATGTTALAARIAVGSTRPGRSTPLTLGQLFLGRAASRRRHGRSCRCLLPALGPLSRARDGPFLRLLCCRYVFDDQVSEFRRIRTSLLSGGRFVDTATCVSMVRGETPIAGRNCHLASGIWHLTMACGTCSETRCRSSVASASRWSCSSLRPSSARTERRSRVLCWQHRIFGRD